MPEVMEPDTMDLRSFSYSLEVSLCQVVRVKRLAIFLTEDQVSSSLAFP
jgi:hypothetical protein